MVGDRVALGPLRKDLVPTYTRWYNDFHTLRTLDTIPGPLTIEQDERQHERLVALSQTQASFTVYERSGCRPIGSAGLLEIDYRNRTAELALAIAEPDARGKGYGTETTRLVVDYAFTALGLHNVMLTVIEVQFGWHSRLHEGRLQGVWPPSGEHLHGRQAVGYHPHGMLVHRVGPESGAGAGIQAG